MQQLYCVTFPEEQESQSHNFACEAHYQRIKEHVEGEKKKKKYFWNKKGISENKSCDFGLTSCSNSDAPLCVIVQILNTSLIPLRRQ